MWKVVLDSIEADKRAPHPIELTVAVTHVAHHKRKCGMLHPVELVVDTELARYPNLNIIVAMPSSCYKVRTYKVILP
jgi:hypothetical protein